MKKVKIFFASVLFIALSACNITDTPIELQVTNSITKDIAVTVTQTNGTQSLSESTTVNLSDIVSNVADITDVKINSLTYKFKDFTGNTAGRVETISLKINNSEFATGTDIDPSQQESFTVDSSKFAALESILENDSQTTLAVDGSMQSNAGDMSFNIEISIDLTVTLNN